MKILLYTRDSALVSEWKNKLHEHEIFLLKSDPKIFDSIASGSFDIICFDVDGNPKEDIANILNSNSKSNILALSREPSFILGRECLEYGVKGYANSHMQAIHFMDAVSNIKNGNIWLYPEFIQNMIVLMTKESVASKKTDILEKLTPKEKDIANLIYQGLSNQEIADATGITLRTVKAHTSAIFEKTDVKDRINLVLLMRNNG